MSTALIKLYNILIDKGVDRKAAEEAVAEFLTRSEASELLVTKEDFRTVRHDIAQLEGRFYRALLIQTGAITAILTGILSVFF
jgi:hypothetical protein